MSEEKSLPRSNLRIPMPRVTPYVPPEVRLDRESAKMIAEEVARAVTDSPAFREKVECIGRGVVRATLEEAAESTSARPHLARHSLAALLCEAERFERCGWVLGLFRKKDGSTDPSDDAFEYLSKCDPKAMIPMLRMVLGLPDAPGEATK